MSVIAKVLVRSVQQFGAGQLLELGCVAENDMMAGYATSHEDKLFSRYSPSGDIKLYQPIGYAMGMPEPEPALAGTEAYKPKAYYVMVVTPDEAPDPTFGGWSGAAACCQAVCHSRTEFGRSDVQVEFRDARVKDAPAEHNRGVERLSWRMMIDNPPASDQIKAGAHYLIAFYPADRFDRDGAIIAALHGSDQAKSQS